VFGVTGEKRVIELRNQSIGGTVPELENRRNQADASHLVGKAGFRKQIESGWMGRRRARIGLQAVIVVEQPDRNALAAKQPRAQQSNWPAARNQDSRIVTHHGNFCIAMRRQSTLNGR
jgi:hypothetical protein